MDIKKLLLLQNGKNKNVDLTANTLVVGSIKIGGDDPNNTELTKTILDNLINNGGGGGSDTTFTATAGENIPALTPIYISPGASDGGRIAGRVYIVDPSNPIRKRFVGITQTSVAPGNNVVVQNAGVLSGFSGLSIGASVYWDGVNYQYTDPGPTDSWVRVGIVNSATSILVGGEKGIIINDSSNVVTTDSYQTLKNKNLCLTKTAGMDIPDKYPVYLSPGGGGGDTGRQNDLLYVCDPNNINRSKVWGIATHAVLQSELLTFCYSGVETISGSLIEGGSFQIGNSVYWNGTQYTTKSVVNGLYIGEAIDSNKIYIKSWLDTFLSEFKSQDIFDAEFSPSMPFADNNDVLDVNFENSNIKSAEIDYLVKHKCNVVESRHKEENKLNSIISGYSKMNSYINCIAVDSSSSVYIGGNFINYNGVPGRSYLLKITSSGDLDETFLKNAVDGGKFNSDVKAICVSPSNQIYVGGFFINYNNILGRNYLIKLNTLGKVDETFVSAAVDGGKFNGYVKSIAIDSSNNVYVGGDFINYDGDYGNNHLVKLNGTTGAVNATFMLNAVYGMKFNGSVEAIAIDSSNNVYVGGYFTNYNGVFGRDYLVKLNGTTGVVDTTFVSAAVDGGKFNSIVKTIAIDSSNNVYVGGFFSDYDGVYGRNQLVKLNGTTGDVDTTFVSTAVDGGKFTSTVETIVIDSSNNVYVGGNFLDYDGVLGRNCLVKLYGATGALDLVFVNEAVDGGKISNGLITGLAITSNSYLWAVGNFLSYNGIYRHNYLVVFSIGGGFVNFTVSNKIIQTIKSKFNNYINSIAVFGNDLYVAGSFTKYNDSDNINYLFKINLLNHSLDFGFLDFIDKKFNSKINALATDSFGNLYVGGNFTNYGGILDLNYLVKIIPNGMLDTLFAGAANNGKFNGGINVITVDSSNNVYVAGAFTNYGGVPGRDYLVKLNGTTGAVDTTFVSAAVDGGKFNNYIYSIAIDSSNNVYIGGKFTAYAGTAGRDRLVKLNGITGAVDTTFVSAAVDGGKFSDSILTLAIDSSNNIYVGGSFVDYAGVVGRNLLVKLNGTTGAVDTTFVSAAVDGGQFNAPICTLAIDSSNNVFVGGHYVNYGWVTGRDRLVKLNGTSGALDVTFTSNASGPDSYNNFKFSDPILKVILHGSSVYVAGLFKNYSNINELNYLIKLNSSNGMLDSAFNHVSIKNHKKTFDNIISAIATDALNNIYVGGFFTNYGQTFGRSYLIKFNLKYNQLDLTFMSNAVDGWKFNSAIRSIAVDSSNNVYVGGDFTNYGGISGRNRLVKLNGITGAVDTTFVSAAVDGGKFNNQVYCVVVKGAEIYVGGSFTNYGGVSGRNRLVKLNGLNGTVDTAFVSTAVDGSKFNNSVYTLDVDASNNVYVGGDFTNYGGVSGRNRLVKLNGTTGNLDMPFVLTAVNGNKFNSTIRTLVVDSFSGSVYVGGDFTNYAGTFGRSYLVKLNSTTGAVDTAFVNAAVDGWKFNNTITCLSLNKLDSNDTSLFAVGSFGSYNNTNNFNRVVKLNKNSGVLDFNFFEKISGLVGTVLCCFYKDNTLYIGGNYFACPSVKNGVIDYFAGIDCLLNTEKTIVEFGKIYLLKDPLLDEWDVEQDSYSALSANITFDTSPDGQLRYTLLNPFTAIKHTGYRAKLFYRVKFKF